MKWFKFFGQDWMTDPNIIRLTPVERLCFLTLLCLASASEVAGTVSAIDDQTLLLLTHIPKTDDTDILPLKKLKDNGMITIDNGIITIKNFTKRQSIQLTPYDRIKKYRMKQKNDNEMITIEENRIDKNRLDNKKEQAHAFNKKVFEYNQQLTGIDFKDKSVDRLKYPKLIRNKFELEDVLKAMYWGWNLRRKDGFYYWRDNWLLSKLYYRIIPDYLETKKGVQQTKQLSELKKQIGKPL